MLCEVCMCSITDEYIIYLFLYFKIVIMSVIPLFLLNVSIIISVTFPEYYFMVS